MQYFDIHTHQPAIHPEDIAVVNFDPVRMKSEFLSEKNRISPGKNLFSCGIHPWHISDTKRQLDELKSLLSSPEIVAVGEAGLDKLIQTQMSVQQDVFLVQVQLAEEFAKPLIIHCVKAWEEIEAVKKKLKPGMPWIIHGFRGNEILATQLIRQGFYLSFGVNFNPESVRIAWPDRLLIETDDKPVDIRFVYKKIAEALSVEEDLLVQQVADNIACLGLIK